MSLRISNGLRKPEVWLVLLFALTIPFITPYLRGDGVGYYAWLRSPVIEGDLQFEDEYRRGDPAFRAHTFDERGDLSDSLRTPTGHVRNQWGVGSAVLWAPFFLIAHGLTRAGGAAGADWQADGYALPYLWLTAFGTALYAFLGLLVAYWIARRFLPETPGAALIGLLAVWGASSLLIYQYFVPFWPFGVGIFVSALLFLLWSRRGWGWRRWLGLGVLSGLAPSVHPVGVAWVVLPLLSLAGLEAGGLRERSRATGVWMAGGLLGAAPQLIGKAIVHGSPLDTGYRERWELSGENFLRALFGADHGLISWTPIAGLALLGLVWLFWRKDRRLGGGLLGVFATMLLIVGVYGSYEQSSFGNRFFVLFTPGFVVGAAALAASVWPKGRTLLAAGTVALIAWNLLFAFQWAWGLIPKRGPVAWEKVVGNQFTAAPRELVRAASLFVTDRAALIRHVQETDLQRIEAGEG